MPLERIVVVGNDDVAAIAAAMLAKAVRPPFVAVDHLRPAEPPSAWATLPGAATLTPATAAIGDAFGQDELAVLRAARGSFLLGSILRGFGADAPAFLPFGTIGEPAGQVAFHHLVSSHRARDPALPLSAFMGASLCAQTGRFAPPPASDAAAQAAFDYGLYVDAGRYAALAGADGAAAGVRVVEGSVAFVERDEAGRIAGVVTEAGTRVTGDLFVDCGNWLDDDVPVVDWSRWLPCNRFAGMMRDVPAAPATAMQLVAHAAGWQRQGSLAGAVVDQFAFCDALPGDWPTTAVPFRSGRCETPWVGNCVAIGDGAAILDPIADMRLSLAIASIARLAGLLPTTQDHAVEAREYNRQTLAELDDARDFAIAHFHLNGRAGDPFWSQCRAVEPPASLAERIALYRSCGRIAQFDGETQPPSAWIALFDALGVRPRRGDALADMMPAAEVDRHLMQVRSRLAAAGAAMPPYAETMRLIAG